jgi:hypothetical protein
VCGRRGCSSGRQAIMISSAYEKFHKKNMTRSPNLALGEVAGNKSGKKAKGAC